MTDRTGVLKNSPLILALASVRFASWPLIGQKIEIIHDELREITPLIQNVKIRQGGPAEEVVMKAWVFLSADRTLGIQLTEDQLLVFSRKYLRYADFEETIEKALKVLYTHMRFMDITSMGARYVDHIKPITGDKAESYIDPGLMPGKFAGFDRTGGAVVGAYKKEKNELRVRCITQPGAMAIPEDLIGLLAMANEPGKNLQIDVLNNEEIILDMDALEIFETPIKMNISEIKEYLKKLHQTANDFFRHENVCTSHAFEVWKG